MAISAGTYQFVSMLDYASVISAVSPTRGADVTDWGAGNEDNLQKFDVTITAGKCLLTMCKSGLALEYQPAPSIGDVCMNNANPTNTNQLWYFTTVDNITYHGVTCDVFNIAPVEDSGNYLTSQVTARKVNTNGGMTVEEPQVSSPYLLGQQWIAYPTKPTNEGIIIPTIMGWAETVGGDGSFEQSSAAKLYPVWRGSYSWAYDTQNYWEGCYSTCELDAKSGVWGLWSDYSAWTQLTTTSVDDRFWDATGLNAVVPSTLKAKRYRFMVRAVSVINNVEYVGHSESAMLTANYVPPFSITTAAFGPLGLKLEATSPYTDGTNLVVFRVVDEDGNVISPWWVQDGFKGSTGTLSVPLDSIYKWLEEDEQITVVYRNGTDNYWSLLVKDESEQELTVTYDAGHGVTLDPQVTVGPGRTLVVDVNSSLPNEAVYIRRNGKLTAMDKNDDGTFSCLYPFSETFELYCVAYSSDMTSWGTWEETITPTSAYLGGRRPCHAWNWDGGSFLLEISDAVLSTERKLEATYDAVTLDSRKYQSVLFSKTVESTYEADGILKHGLTESDKQQLLALLNAQHVTYRAPQGDVAEVAITSVSYVDWHEYTKVNVEMIQETR